tara:strand:- start:204 stop:386 length:183 start_codon:yes stop_codon:yes gene_type:complete
MVKWGERGDKIYNIITTFLQRKLFIIVIILKDYCIPNLQITSPFRKPGCSPDGTSTSPEK